MPINTDATQNIFRGWACKVSETSIQGVQLERLDQGEKGKKLLGPSGLLLNKNTSRSQRGLSAGAGFCLWATQNVGFWIPASRRIDDHKVTSNYHWEKLHAHYMPEGSRGIEHSWNEVLQSSRLDKGAPCKHVTLKVLVTLLRDKQRFSNIFLTMIHWKKLTLQSDWVHKHGT